MKKGIVTTGVFGIYIIVLSWLILFKFSFSINDLYRVRDINLIPYNYRNIAPGNIAFSESFYNILVFIPLGVYFRALNSKKFISNIFYCFVVSMIFEVTQYVLAIGWSDITDLINNTIGGFLGVIIYCILEKIFKQKALSVVNTLGMLLEVIFFGLAIILFVYNT